MIYFQSILSLYETTTEDKHDIIIQQLVTYTEVNKQQDSFFQFLLEYMENTNQINPTEAKSILNISVDFLNSQNPQFSLSNIKQYVQFLLKLFSLKAQPSSYSKYKDFLIKSFQIVGQYNQDSLFSSISKIPHEQSIIPLSILYTQNKTFFDQLLNIFLKSFSNFQKDNNLIIYSTAITNFLLNTENKNKNDPNNSTNKSIAAILDKIFADKFLSSSPKFDLFDASLKYLPQKLSDDLLSTHCLNLISSVSISNSISEIPTAVDFAKTVLIRLKECEFHNLTCNKLIDSVITYILPNSRSDINSNASLTDFFKEVDKEYIQSKITSDIRSENISFSTLFLISRYPTPDTIPHLLSRARVDPISQYSQVFHFLSHNLVPFRYLPRFFEILEVADLHFLNEIFEKKTILYCTAAVKFLSQCNTVEKIDFIAFLFKSAKSLPIIKSEYAQSAFITVTCFRALSKDPQSPIKLLLNYLNACINETERGQNEGENEIVEEEEDKSSDEEQNNSNFVEGHVMTSEITFQPSQILSDSLADSLDLTNDDIKTIQDASNSDSQSLHHFDVKKNWDQMNVPNFSLSRWIQSSATSNEERRDSMIKEAHKKMKENNVIYSIIIGCISNDPVLIHDCVLTLSLSDHYLLTFFFATSATCNEAIILKEIREYIKKEPETAPQSFVSRLFSTKANTINRRQRVARRCIISIAPFVNFSNDLYETLLQSFPSDLEPYQVVNQTTENAEEAPKVKPSNSNVLVCESIISVCRCAKNKEDLHLILQKLIQNCDSFEPSLFVKTLISVLSTSKQLTDKDSLSVMRLWIKLLLANKVNFQANEQTFEPVFLDNKNATKNYLKEMENAIRTNGEVPSLFASFKRAIPFLKDFNLSKQPQFLTLIISNTLSENDVVLEFCVNILRSTFEMTTTLNPLKGVVFSNEYIRSVQPFFTELSSKFNDKQLIQLSESLLSFYQEKQSSNQESIFLFVVFSVLKRPQLFVSNKFVIKISTACEKMTKMNDYALIFYISQAFDAMNQSDKTTFFNEFITVKTSDFSSIYFSKYSSYYETLEPILIPRLLQLRSIDSKYKNLLEFERLLKLLNVFVKFYVKDTTSPDQISKLIFIFLLIISTINIIRNRNYSIEFYLSIYENTLIEFKNMTGIFLINTNSRLSIKKETDFYEFLSTFSQSFQFMKLNVLNSLISSIETLRTTKHSECGLLCLSSYFVSISNSKSISSETNKKKHHIVDLITAFLKNNKFDVSFLSFVVSKLPSAFTVTTLQEMDENYLTTFLKINFEIASKTSDYTPSLHLILNIIRSSTPNFIQPFIQQIIDSLREAISNGNANLSSILVLNVIGELCRRKMEPTVLLKDSAVSFRSLAPLLLSDDNDIKTRVNCIFSLIIFGKSEIEPDFELVFSSLMSLFVVYEKETANYVSIATDMMKTIEKKTVITKRSLEMLKFAFEPVLSVGDANCTVAICELLKYLKKLTIDINLIQSKEEDNEDMFSFVLGMMTLFAKPKRNFPIPNS